MVSFLYVKNNVHGWMVKSYCKEVRIESGGAYG